MRAGLFFNFKIKKFRTNFKFRNIRVEALKELIVIILFRKLL